MRFRGQVLSLDTSARLANGNPVGLGALLTLLHPARGSYTCTVVQGRIKVIGQVVYRMQQRPARISFLLPENELTSENLSALLEALLAQSGEMGATCVLGELPEAHPALETFRRCGFSIYAWQHVWKLPAFAIESPSQPSPWQAYTSDRELAVRLLYQSLVPPLVQCSEQPLPAGTPAWTATRRGELIAYAEGRFGTHGVVLNTLFHPEADDIPALVASLAQKVPSLGRPIHLVVRLYQAHLAPALEKLSAEQQPIQALLARHLTRPVVEEALVSRRKIAHAHQAEPTASVLHNNK